MGLYEWDVVRGELKVERVQQVSFSFASSCLGDLLNAPPELIESNSRSSSLQFFSCSGSEGFQILLGVFQVF